MNKTDKYYKIFERYSERLVCFWIFIFDNVKWENYKEINM